MSSAHLISCVTQYGYLGLYAILGISILGIPIPDETLMVFIGFLTYEGKLNPVLAVLAAASGSISGITVAYFLGRLFQQRVLIHLKKHAGSARLDKVLNWYHRHGGKLLTIGYFIPGVRHLSGYIAGLSRLRYKSFAFFAYLGAILWVTVWVSLGRLLGSRWEAILPIIHRYALLLGITAAVLLLAIYLLYKNHERLGSLLYSQLQRLPERYMSLGKRRLFVTIGGLLFLVLFIVLMGLIQDFVAHEVGQFDGLVANWLAGSTPLFLVSFMQKINAIGTHLFILVVFVIVVMALRFTTKRWTHVLPLALAWVGGTLIDYLFRLIFKGYSFSIFENLIPFQAPSQGFLIAALSFYAVLGYILGRHKRRMTQFLILIVECFLLLFLALSPIYLRIHPPSTMVMSLTVSGLLAIICLFIYEFRLQPPR
ncbi:SNARE associated Golgi protein [Acididesulfobacillus acetoxydans]|uniref:SNARE associated Golgi protein n=1 Tax=Acididesulfobacillus acetoxydans TaxID=1561005 RepID=A0A8S0WRF9_9FIRM|nr:DedA family protein [Acididesulfobacillus acetoxydans]CAA7603274.1 SNARE associated Golgi protein [Acididesulfobacillus acetoxydans]